MARFRRLSQRQRRLWMAFVALAMLVRLLVPAGWMPVADAAGSHLALCDGGMPVAKPMHGMRHGPTHGKAPMHHQGPSDHPCSFAGPAAALDTPVLDVPLPPAAPRHVAVTTHLVAAIGHGLAAPPPPATGPPAFA